MTSRTPIDSPTAFAIAHLGIEPHRTQAQLLESPAAVKVVCAGRRSGKSLAQAIETSHFAVVNPGTTQLLIGPTQGQALITFNLITKLIDEGPLQGLLVSSVQHPYPKLVLKSPRDPNQMSTILVRSAGHDGRYLRGLTIDRLVADEMAFIPESVLDEAVLPMLATSQHRKVVFCSTPWGRNHFYTWFLRGQSGDPDIASFHFPSSANPHVSREFLVQQRERLTDAAFRTEYGAEFLDDRAAVFRRSLIESAIDDSIDTGTVHHGHSYVIGFDPARYRDRSSVVVLDITSTPYRVVQIRDLSQRDYTTQIDAVTDLAHRYDDAMVVLDTTGGEQLLDQLAHHGINVEHFQFTPKSKALMIDEMVLSFERRRIRIPPDPELIRELEHFQYQLNPGGRVHMGAPNRAGSFDDYICALGMALSQAKPYSLYGDDDTDTDDLATAWNELPLATLGALHQRQLISDMRRNAINPQRDDLENYYIGLGATVGDDLGY